MTKKNLQKIILFVTVLYSAAIIIGVTIYSNDNTEKKTNYAVFKDLIPFIIALPAAYLGFCFQRRSNYQLALRQLWTNLISSTQQAFQYTHLKNPGEDEYHETLLHLSISIEEVRGVYCNLKETSNTDGHYPFESLKKIHEIITELNFGESDELKSKEARKQIAFYWKNIRKTFLAEFDRPVPTVFDSPYVDRSK